MWLLFLDEFGDFSIPNSFFESGRYQHPQYRSVCGYAGFLIPANEYMSFSRKFFELRIKENARLLGLINSKNFTEKDIENRYPELFTIESNREIVRKYTRSIYTKTMEAKGKDVFSSSYLKSNTRTINQKRAILRKIFHFVDLIKKHRGQIFFTGINKEHYFIRNKKKITRNLHTSLVRQVLERAYLEAKDIETQITLIFDHHGVDDESKTRIEAKKKGVNVSSHAAYQTRQEYCQEIIVENRYFDYMKEPLFPVESHWSLGVQAADWICSILNKCRVPTDLNDIDDETKGIFRKIDALVTNAESNYSAIYPEASRRNGQLDFFRYWNRSTTET